MRTVSQTTQFSKDIKKMLKRGKNVEKIKTIVTKLAQGDQL
jgi:mRNA-degrading endonuclease YafQ of YafQ-DinJ toxin-antitoxin module